MRTRKITDRCLSDLVLDGLVLDELAEAKSSAARSHLSGCEACAARLVEIEADRAQAAASMPPFQTLRASQTTRESASESVFLRLRRYFSAPVLVPVLAAAVLLIFWRTKSPDLIDATRTKGGASLVYFVKSETGAVLGGVDERLSRDDAVRFRYSSTRSAFLAIISLDGAGQLTVYHSAGPLAARIDAGDDHDLPGSVVLDDVLGTEHIFGFFCDTAIEAQRAVEAVSENSKNPTLDGCAVSRLSWQKVAP